MPKLNNASRDTGSKPPVPKVRLAKARKEERSYILEGKKGEPEGEILARAMMAPYLRHGQADAELLAPAMGKGCPDVADFAYSIRAKVEETATGSMEFVGQLLVAQATTLDCIFTEMARRSAANSDRLDASERLMRIALKAQANSRATLEALVKLHQPREQTVRHVHVNEGGQAIVADQFHNHTGGQENGKPAEQPHATGTGAAGSGTALPSPDPFWVGVPISSGEGEATVPDARRQGQRGA